MMQNSLIKQTRPFFIEALVHIVEAKSKLVIVNNRDFPKAHKYP